MEKSRPGGRVVGANQKESLERGKLCEQALLMSKALIMVAVAVAVAVLAGFFIPSITQKTSFGGLEGAINEKTSTFSSAWS